MQASSKLIVGLSVAVIANLAITATLLWADFLCDSEYLTSLGLGDREIGYR